MGQICQQIALAPVFLFQYLFVMPHDRLYTLHLRSDLCVLLCKHIFRPGIFSIHIPADQLSRFFFCVCHFTLCIEMNGKIDNC